MSELLQTWGLRKEEKSPKIPAETKDFLLSQDGTVCEFWKAKLFGTSKRSEQKMNQYLRTWAQKSGSETHGWLWVFFTLDPTQRKSHPESQLLNMFGKVSYTLSFYQTKREDQPLNQRKKAKRSTLGQRTFWKPKMAQTALFWKPKIFGTPKRSEEKMSDFLRTWGLIREEKSPKIPAETKDLLLSRDGTVYKF